MKGDVCMIHKNRCNRRVVRLRKINHKLRIEKHVFGFSDKHINDMIVPKLDKGKVHCSCNLCACKSTKMRKSKYSGSGHIHYNSKSWYSVNDRRKFDEMTDKLKEHYMDLTA